MTQKHFPRADNLPPYIFALVDEYKKQAAKLGHEVIDFGMGNPDQPTAPHIVNALKEAVEDPKNHRYSHPTGLPELREAMRDWYYKRYNVELDPEAQIISTIGSKEGLAHLALAMTQKGDTVMVPAPAYPIHEYGFKISEANVVEVAMGPGEDILSNIIHTIQAAPVKPKVLMLNFPSNPTSVCVDLVFFEKVIEIAKAHDLWVIQDLAYADITFDGYQAPSILQVPGALECAVETYSLSKSYNMPGWRVGFVCGCADMVQALRRVKSYIDYGHFAPVGHAAVAALKGSQTNVKEMVALYKKRRDLLCDGLNDLGWQVEKPKATMFVWAKIPHQYLSMGSLEFVKALVISTGVAVSPGIGFGLKGDQFVRFSLAVSEKEIKMALSKLKNFFE